MPAARLPTSPGTPPHSPLASATGGGSTSGPVLASARKRPRITRLGTSCPSLPERPLRRRPLTTPRRCRSAAGSTPAAQPPPSTPGDLMARLTLRRRGRALWPIERNPAPGPGKTGGGVANFTLIAGGAMQRVPQPVVRLRLGRGALQRDTACTAVAAPLTHNHPAQPRTKLALHTTRAHGPATAPHPAQHPPPAPPLAPS